MVFYLLVVSIPSNAINHRLVDNYQVDNEDTIKVDVLKEE
jgi:hypothetical protein